MKQSAERERIERVVEKVLDKFGLSSPPWETPFMNDMNRALSAITKNELAKERGRVRRMIKPYVTWFHKTGCRCVTGVTHHDNNKCDCGLMKMLAALSGRNGRR